MQVFAISIGQHLAEEFKQTTWLEWIGAITGIYCVYLAAKQNIWNWPIAIIGVFAYTVVFYKSMLYGDAGLQVYFFGTCIYGWYFWIKKKERHEKPVTSLNAKEYALIFIAILVLSLSLGIFLKEFTPTNVPYIDGFCTAVSFIAQILLARKVSYKIGHYGYLLIYATCPYTFTKTYT